MGPGTGRGPGRRARPAPAVRYVNRARRWATVSMLAATLLLALSFQGAWWQGALAQDSTFTGKQISKVTVSFELGGAVACSSWNWTSAESPCGNVSTNLAGVGHAAYAVFALLVAGLVGLGALAAGLAIAENVGVRRTRQQLRVEIGVVGLLALVGGAVLIATVAFGVGTTGHATCSYLSGEATDCPFFWGSSGAGTIDGGCAYCANYYTWGAGLGFYEATAAVILALLTAWFLWVSRTGPFTPAEEEVWARRFRPLSPAPGPGPARIVAGTEVRRPAAAAAPVSAWERRRPTARGPAYEVATAEWTCPNCGTLNSRWAGQCGQCAEDRPVGPGTGG